MARAMTQEAFEALLLEIRDGSQLALSGMAGEHVTGEARHSAKIDDVRAVWHAAEFALAMINANYIPKHEALEDARDLLDRIESES